MGSYGSDSRHWYSQSCNNMTPRDGWDFTGKGGVNLNDPVVVVRQPEVDTATKALRVRVNNVVTRDDYRAVTAAMRGIQTLDHVRPVAVQGETLTLELQGVGDAETLTRLMVSRTDLIWVSSDPDSDEGLVLAWRAP